MKSGGSIVGGEARERYPSRGLGEQCSVAAVHHPPPAFDAADDAILHRLVRVVPVALDRFVAVKEDRNLSIGSPFCPQIECGESAGGQRAFPDRLDESLRRRESELHFFAGRHPQPAPRLTATPTPNGRMAANDSGLVAS